MTLLVLVILAVIWAAVLLPPFIQNRTESRPADSMTAAEISICVTVASRMSIRGSRAGFGRPNGEWADGAVDTPSLVG